MRAGQVYNAPIVAANGEIARVDLRDDQGAGAVPDEVMVTSVIDYSFPMRMAEP
jgi:hypothetical protein